VATGALFGLAGNAMRRSDYARVAALMAYPSQSSLDCIRVADMLGHVQLHNARFEQSAALFQAAWEESEQSHAPLWAARAARHLAQACMWFDPNRTLQLIPRARELNQSVGELNGVAQCDMAAAMAYALCGEWESAAPLLAEARRRFEELGATRELLPIDPIEVLHHTAIGRTDQAAAGAAWMADAATRGRPVCVPVWVAVTTLWTGQPDLFDFASIGWLDSVEAARARWMEPLERLREVAQR
jgi:hypothetical protein